MAIYGFLCFINSAIWSSNALGLSIAITSPLRVNIEIRVIGLAHMNGLGGLTQRHGSALFPAKDAPASLADFYPTAHSLYSVATSNILES
ncbi:uncharacterized protein Z518_04105 [Rhinocladiella mackenziei CBS 650.93]|uniref:Rhinocladiella mackenziei CBS 650.93 unplaced genomic scaffold supercont1.3, whole genome shotgun sequence n=1 Tax=Rhinocladiella mackenziei CBS 650.93 TaxID=1442369 RepID=A0A0D2ISK7_9EURO|nr:uncharacterized protein Z518_04105 [Rhinocladiella mackenziei CBS 650.93]KIX06131.1 hypothetical protein Z518_04105 [Rhinocladiella mackenziei CBS 650.93]